MASLKRFFATLPGDPLRAMIVVLIGATVLFQLLTPVSSTVALASMARFHLRSSSGALWGLLQVVPSMYSFENRFWVTEEPLADEELDEPPGSMGNYINHYPIRILTYGYERQKFGGLPRPVHVTLRSRYQGQDLVTRLKATVQHEGDTNLIRLELVEKSP